MSNLSLDYKIVLLTTKIYVLVSKGNNYELFLKIYMLSKKWLWIGLIATSIITSIDLNKLLLSGRVIATQNDNFLKFNNSVPVGWALPTDPFQLSSVNIWVD
jgi:hypothetical protein